MLKQGIVTRNSTIKENTPEYPLFQIIINIITIKLVIKTI